jgi:hypothetical protein
MATALQTWEKTAPSPAEPLWRIFANLIIYCKGEFRAKRNPPTGIICRPGETGCRPYRGNVARSSSPLSPEKGATGHRVARYGFSSEGSKNSADLNKSHLRAISMVNEIVTRVSRNFWYYGGKTLAEKI